MQAAFQEEEHLMDHPPAGPLALAPSLALPGASSALAFGADRFASPLFFPDAGKGPKSLGL
jgi:hypothetical protein